MVMNSVASGSEETPNKERRWFAFIYLFLWQHYLALVACETLMTKNGHVVDDGVSFFCCSTLHCTSLFGDCSFFDSRSHSHGKAKGSFHVGSTLSFLSSRHCCRWVVTQPWLFKFIHPFRCHTLHLFPPNRL